MKHLPNLLALAIALAPTLSLAESRDDDAQSGTRLDVVRINADRLQTEPQQTPSSSTVIDGSELQRQGIDRLEDLPQLAPGLDITTTDPYDTRVTVRGVGDGGGTEINIGMPSSVGLFLDGVYLSRPGMLSGLLDIDSATLLAGPQGTLYGFNTTGGAIDIRTRKPTFEREGSISQSLGQRGYNQTQFMYSGALSENWAGRINLSHSGRDGHVRNRYTGNELGGSEQNGIRGQLLWTPSDDFSLRLSADYNAATTKPVAVLAAVHEIPGYSNGFLTRAANAGANPVVGGVNQDAENRAKLKQGGVSAQAEWTLDGGYTLRSTTAVRYFGFKPSTTDIYDVPLYANSGADVHERIWSQEVRLDSPRGEHFDYTLGAIYWGQNTDTYAHDYYADNPAVQPYIGNASRNGLLVQRWGELDMDVFSAFAQGTWHVTQQFDISAGLRVSDHQQTGSFVRKNFNEFDSRNLGSLRQHKQLPAGLLNFSYWFQPNLQGYLTLAYGEKAGGLNVSSGAAARAGFDSLLVEPETTRGVELGVKGDWFEQRLSASAALFLSKVRDFQTTAYDEDENGLYSHLTNAGDMRSRGLAASLSVRPVEGLSFGFDGTLLDARYTDYSNAACPPEVSLAGGGNNCDFSGDRVFSSPKFSYTLTGRYEWGVGHGLDASVAANWSHRTWAYGTVRNSDYTRIPSYGLLNLSAGIAGKVGEGRWEGTVWVRNALDKQYWRSLRDGSWGEVTGTLGDPRTLGVTVKYDF